MVVRHAKAADGSHDHARRLRPGGRADAKASGHLVAAALETGTGVGRAVALVSSADRAYETWQQVAAALPDGTAVDERVLDALYDTEVDVVIGLLSGLEDESTRAVVVAHNPTLEEAVHTLAGGGDPECLARLDRQGLPTSAVAVLTYDGPWSGLARGTCALVALDVGRA